MLSIQLLFPTAILLCLGRAASLSSSMEPLSVQAASSKWPLSLENCFFILYIRYIRFLALENHCPVSFWEHRAWLSDSQVEAWGNLPCPQEQKAFYRLARVYSPIKNKWQDKCTCCSRVNSVVVSLQNCQVCVYLKGEKLYFWKTKMH